MPSIGETPRGPALLDRRVLFVVGKGGVGKSVIAAALARLGAERGRRVLLVHLCPAPAPNEHRARPATSLPPGIVSLTVDGEQSLDEYLGLALPHGLHRLVVRSRMYREFVRLAPGLRELMAIGKIAHEERRTREGDPAAFGPSPASAAPAWDLIIVDSPASGHSVQHLRMPAAAARAFGAGLVRREAERVFAALHNPARTAVCSVTTPEELAVGETLETRALLAAEGLPLGPVFVNRTRDAPLSPESIPEAPPDAPALVVEALACAREQSARAAAHAGQIARLRNGLTAAAAAAASNDVAVVLLPHLAGGQVDDRGLADLAARIAAQLGAATTPAATARGLDREAAE